jgi:hypothetical protein
MAGSQDMIIIVVMMMMMSSVFAVLAGGAYFMTQPQEGDECKGTSVGGNYVIDENGDCVLDYCDYGYTESNGGCVVVVPDGDEDDDDSGGGGGSGNESGGGGGSGNESGGGGDNETGPVTGRYIRLQHTIAQDLTRSGDDNDKNLTIELAELEVFGTDGSTNIALNAPVSAANYHGAGPLENLTDGDFSNFMHTLGRTAVDYDTVLVDLGSSQEITKIKITNRGSGNRAIGIVTSILDTSQSPVISLPALSSAKNSYTWDFNSTEGIWAT